LWYRPAELPDDTLGALGEFLDEHHRLGWTTSELAKTHVLLFMDGEELMCVIWFEWLYLTEVMEGHLCVAPGYRNGRWMNRHLMTEYWELVSQIRPRPRGVICEVWSAGVASVLRLFGFTFCRGFPLAYLDVEGCHVKEEAADRPCGPAGQG
jgi:hypothetical protein